MPTHVAPVDLLNAQTFWSPAVNGLTVVPPFGVVVSTGSTTGNGFDVTQPTTDSQYALIAGPHGIAASGYGAVATDGVMYALYDEGDGTPVVGQVWGAGAASFKLRAGNAGFRVVGTPDAVSFTVPVVRQGSSANFSFGGSGGECPNDTVGLCASVDACDPLTPNVQAVRDVFASDGIIYVQRGYLEIISVNGRAAPNWCTLTVEPIGCVPCPGEPLSCCDYGIGGSGATVEPGDGFVGGPGDPDAPGGGGPEQEDCCGEDEYEDPVSVVIVGPFGADCAEVELFGEIAFNPIQGGWGGELSDGEALENSFQMKCFGGEWRWWLVTETADGATVFARGTLDASGAFLSGSGVAAPLDCDPATVSVVAAHPCAEVGSGPGSGGGADPSFACCDPGESATAELSVTSEDCPGACASPITLTRAGQYFVNNAFECFGHTCAVGIVCLTNGENPVSWALDFHPGGGTPGTTFLDQDGTTLTGSVIVIIDGDTCQIDVEIELPPDCYTPP